MIVASKLDTTRCEAARCAMVALATPRELRASLNTETRTGVDFS